MTQIGDDLLDARDFVNSTMSSMDILLSDARFNVELAKSSLKDIQLDARTLCANGISRAAQSVLDCYNSDSSQPKIDGRLMALYKLTTQYAQGLDEISPAPSVVAIASNTTTEIPLTLSPTAKFKAARETLIPLIKFSGQTAPALQRLAGLELDIPIKSNEPHVSFESLMPDITDSALRAARTQGKSVSVSYAADGLAFADSQVGAIREQLEHIVTRLVRTRIAPPNTRMAKGLSRGGHIDISALETPKGLGIQVACDGEIETLFPKTEPKHIPHVSEPLIDMTMEVGL